MNLTFFFTPTRSGRLRGWLAPPTAIGDFVHRLFVSNPLDITMVIGGGCSDLRGDRDVDADGVTLNGGKGTDPYFLYSGSTRSR